MGNAANARVSLLSIFSSTSICTVASAAASSPGSTTVTPGRASAEDERRHARAGHRDVHSRAPIGRFAAELLGNRARRAQQPLEPLTSIETRSSRCLW